MRESLAGLVRGVKAVRRFGYPLGSLLLVSIAVHMVCSAKVMAADQAETKVEANGSLKEPSEKDGDVAGETTGRQEVDLQKQVHDLQESLALAQAEADYFSQQYKELRLKNQLIGVDVLTGDEQRLQERLVQAVKELYQSKQDQRELTNRLQQMIDATEGLLKTADKLDPQKLADYEVALRSAEECLSGRGSGPIPEATGLQDVQIVHVNPELNSVIINAGSALEVKPGLPFRVIRDGHIIGEIKVFQVRDQVSAALVLDVKDGSQLKAGDRLEIATQ